MSAARRILIVNTSPDTCEMLEEYFRTAGWEAACIATRELREVTTTPAELMRTYRPDVLLVDIAIPYEENWTLAQRLRNDPDVSCPIVLSTTNVSVVRRLLGTREPLHEVVGKPYDLAQLLGAVMRALVGRDEAAAAGERRAGERRQYDRRNSAPHAPRDQSEDCSR